MEKYQKSRYTSNYIQKPFTGGILGLKTVLLVITQGKNQANYIHFHYVTQSLNNRYCMSIAIEEKNYIL